MLLRLCMHNPLYHLSIFCQIEVNYHIMLLFSLDLAVLVLELCLVDGTMFCWCCLQCSFLVKWCPPPPPATLLSSCDFMNISSTLSCGAANMEILTGLGQSWCLGCYIQWIRGQGSWRVNGKSSRFSKKSFPVGQRTGSGPGCPVCVVTRT